MSSHRAACVALAAFLAAPAAAGVTTTFVQKTVPGAPAEVLTWDLTVTIFGNDDWTSTLANATITGDAEFFEHALGSNGAPDPALFAIYPSLAADTFATVPLNDPNAGTNTAKWGFAPTPSFLPTKVSAVWFDTDQVGDGVWVVGRFSVQPSGSAWSLAISGTHTIKNTGLLQPFAFVVPEPPVLPSWLIAVSIGAACARRGHLR